ncbi:hypothetical protein ACFX2C_021122 [Malus domestica]
MGSKKLRLFCIVVASLAVATMAIMKDDEKECADRMADLATCIPFVSGISKKPTPECCENTKKLKANKPKCLCVLIKESTEPSMGLPVNTTLVLQMPSTCDVDGKIFDCLSILNLAPNSPDAKFFKEADSNSSTSPTSNGHESPPTSASATAASSSTSDLSSNCMGWFRCWFSDTLRSSVCEGGIVDLPENRRNHSRSSSAEFLISLQISRTRLFWI